MVGQASIKSNLISPHSTYDPTDTAMLVIHVFCVLSTLANLRTQVFAKRHTPLQNKHLRVAAELWSPFIIFYCNGKEMRDETDECLEKDKMSYGGALWDFLNMVKLTRNVTFSILRPPTPTWGYCHAMNNCSGMIGMVNRREVDFALGRYNT